MFSESVLKDTEKLYQLLYSENFKLGKDFWCGQKVKACHFICVNELLSLNDLCQNNVILKF